MIPEETVPHLRASRRATFGCASGNFRVWYHRETGGILTEHHPAVSMKPSRQQQQAATAKQATAALLVATLIPTLLRILAIVVNTPRWWGLNYLRYFSPAWIVLLSVAVVLPALPAAGKAAGRILRILDSPSGKWVHAVTIVLVLAAIFLFPMKTFYLGDGSIIVPEVYKLGKIPGYHSALLANLPSAPFAGMVITAISVSTPFIFRALGFGIPDTALFPFHILSLICVVALGVATTLVRDVGARWIMLLGLLGLGGTLLFFGYVEFYPVVYVAVVFYLLLAERCIEGKTPMWKVILAYLVALASHYMTLALLPSLLYLVAIRRLPSAGKLVSGKALVYACLSVVVIWVALYGAFGLYDSSSRIIMPLVAQRSPAGVQSYALLTPEHLLDLVNLPLLLCIVPLTFLIVVALSKPANRLMDSALSRFYVISLFFFAMFVIFGNTAFGLARDWDITALAGLIIGLGVYRAVLPRIGKDASNAGLRLAIASCAFVLPWIISNVDPGMSTRKFRDVVALDDAHLFGDYALSGYEALRKYYLHDAALEQQMEIEKRMVELIGYPEQFRLLLKTSVTFVSSNPAICIGTQQWMLGRLASLAARVRAGDVRAMYAISLKAVDSLAAAIAGQATTYTYVDRLDAALQSVVAATGRQTPILVRDGLQAVEQLRYEQGAAMLGAAARSDFHSPRLYGLLGGALLASHRFAESDSVFAEGLRRFPREGELHYLIGLICLSENYRMDDARRHLENALTMDPSDDLAAQIRDILSRFASVRRPEHQ
jgi:tetratricopeptide (TPR) repeat protein